MGATPVVQPLLAIEALSPTLPDLCAYAALAFTSGHGVGAFASLSDHRDLRVFAVGDATAEAARAAGFTDVRSAAGDVNDLARMIEAAALAGPVLAAGAAEPAADLSARVATTRVDQLAVYRAVERDNPPPPGIDLILLHSPRAARHLATLRSTDPALPPLVALSPAVAAPLEGRGRITVAERPDEDSLMQALGKALSHV